MTRFPRSLPRSKPEQRQLHDNYAESEDGKRHDRLERVRGRGTGAASEKRASEIVFLQTTWAETLFEFSPKLGFSCQPYNELPLLRRASRFCTRIKRSRVVFAIMLSKTVLCKCVIVMTVYKDCQLGQGSRGQRKDETILIHT